MASASARNVETWETTTNSVVQINRFDARGGTKADVVGGRTGMRLRVTHEEREELNEDVAASAAMCVFRNGTLRPLNNVPDEVMQRFQDETLRHGGHTAEQLVDALEKRGDTFVTWVDGLNEATLRRLKEIAEAADATASQMNAIDRALSKFQISGPEGSAARQTTADRIVHADPKTPGQESPVPVGR